MINLGLSNSQLQTNNYAIETLQLQGGYTSPFFGGTVLRILFNIIDPGTAWNVENPQFIYHFDTTGVSPNQNMGIITSKTNTFYQFYDPDIKVGGNHFEIVNNSYFTISAAPNLINTYIQYTVYSLNITL